MLLQDALSRLPSEPRTNAVLTFSWEMVQLGALSSFIEQTAAAYDEMFEGLAKLVLRMPNIQNEAGPFTLHALQTAASDGSNKKKELEEFEQILLQMVYARAVDDFLTYLSELVSLIFKTRPETLRSNEQRIPLERILQYSSMDDLVNALTEERIMALAYQGMAQLSDDLDKRLKFALFETPALASEAVHTVEIRNLVVHNRAIVNNTFLSRLDRASIDTTAYKVGLGITFDPQMVRNAAFFLLERAVDISTTTSRARSTVETIVVPPLNPPRLWIAPRARARHRADCADASRAVPSAATRPSLEGHGRRPGGGPVR
jgi:hypothetical protein